jgi:hypothetical protein
MERAVKAVTDSAISILGAAQLFDVPYASLYRKVRSKQKLICGENEVPSTSIGHSTMSSSVLEKTLAERVKHLETRRFGATPKELCIAAYSYATKCGIETPSLISKAQ